MPDRCVVFGCNNSASLEKGISVHRIPFWNDDRPEAKRRRKLWIDFVKKKRAHWTPTQASAVCSVHFTADSYERRFGSLPGLGKPCHPRLKRDEIGIKSFPTLFKPVSEEISVRSHRQVRLI